MKVVILKDFPGVGKRNELKEFNDGYVKNFLIPKGIAAAATGTTISKIQNEERQRLEKIQKESARNQQFIKDLDKRTFVIAMKVGQKNQVFGSVQQKDIAKRIFEKMKVELDKNQIILPKHMKELGEYNIEIRLSANAVAHPKIKLINADQINA